jgi:hypothetical protein
VVLAALLPIMPGGSASHPFSLYVGGLDVIKSPGGTVGAPVESLELVEAGPGNASTLTFRIDDPTGSIGPLPDSVAVLYWDNVNDVPLFRGTLNGYTSRPMPAAAGQWLELSCDGGERELERIVPADSFPSSINVQSAIARLGATWTALNATLGTTPEGDRAHPVGWLGYGLGIPFLQQAVAVAGVTVREAIRQVATNGLSNPVGAAPYPIVPNVTVDAYAGLRVWDPGAQPDDWTTLTVTDTGAVVAQGLEYEVTGGDVVREVYVAGVNAAGSGWFADGSGIRGRQAYLADTTSDTAVKAAAIAQAYLATQATKIRGRFDVLDWTPPTTVHAGGLLNLTNSTIGLAGVVYTIGEISKRFQPSGRQDWSVTFGGQPRSVTGELRRLTRGTLS